MKIVYPQAYSFRECTPFTGTTEFNERSYERCYGKINLPLEPETGLIKSSIVRRNVRYPSVTVHAAGKADDDDYGSSSSSKTAGGSPSGRSGSYSYSRAPGGANTGTSQCFPLSLNFL